MTQFNYRHLLQVTLEATTPLQIGSGDKGIKTDSLVVRDVNDLPFIPGTTLAGLMAHALGKKEKERLMGNQKEGSRLTVTEAKLVGKDGEVIDGLTDLSQLCEENKAFLKNYERLPIRQHVRIIHKGTAEDTGKFDEEVVLKGSHFCFEMELMASEDGSSDMTKLLSTILSPSFRIGSGSRSGFGEIKVVKCLRRDIDLAEDEDRELYLGKSARLGSQWEGWNDVTTDLKNPDACKGWTHYRLTIKPEDFVLFGSGFAAPDGNADMTYVRETFIEWDNGVGKVVEQDNAVLIPASSVKGALSHRTAFHYNKLSGIVVKENGKLENGDGIEAVVGKNNPAVKAIFGSEGEKDNETKKIKNKQRGNILISDVIEKKAQATPKILNHVSIDRFTGGAIDGALFQEQTLYANGEEFDINIMIADKAIEDANIRSAFEAALKDVASGMLPLGGGVNRGNGVFIGKATIYNKENKQWERLV